MSMVVNLGRARKFRDRAAAKTQAAANRVLHGRTRAQRLADVAAAGAAARALDAYQLESGREPGRGEPER